MWNPDVDRWIGSVTILQVIPNVTYRCMELNLSGVPAEIPPSIQNLDLSFNPLKSLGSNYFSAVSALRFLDLTRYGTFHTGVVLLDVDEAFASH